LLQEFLNVGSRRKQKEITTEKCNFPIIGVISRITEGKGVEYTASAFCQILEEYPMARLIVVGEPSDSYSRVAKILSAIDQSAYEFRTREENITDFFAEIDIFVHVPVSADYEAFGLVYIEAIASQVPSIFTISGILKELEHPDRYFHTVPYRDSVAIASAIESLVESIDDTARIVPDAWLNQFSLENTAAEYFEVLKLDKG
jgi:glycosyltransferase involved in cell wall biosynthesis